MIVSMLTLRTTGLLATATVWSTYKSVTDHLQPLGMVQSTDCTMVLWHGLAIQKGYVLAT